MRKLSRILCYLILPIVAVMCFTGCERDMTKEDIANKMSAIKASFKIDNTDTNELFNEEGLVEITYLGSEMEKLATTDYSVIGNFTDVNLKRRYQVLYQNQEKVLKNSLLYYMYMSEEFYSRLDLLNVNAEEINAIYNGLENLEDSFKEFKVAKNKLEQTVDVLTFEGVVRADLTAYSYSVNVLIEDCIEFSNNFIDLVEKRLYNSDINDSNKQMYAKHYLFEACHRLNEVAYYRYFKAYNNVNECDLSKWESGDLLDKIDELVIKAKACAGVSVVVDADDILEFKEVRDSFVQKLGVFKVVYNSMDYYEYNQALLKTAEEESLYKKNVSTVEKANIGLVEQFYDSTLKSYYGDVFWQQISIAG